ncbi:MAG TPA: AAA family ATPase [Acidimicrobiales bacterium]|nr:AAA family ATPase [Acidimicrobiales bacterium]
MTATSYDRYGLAGNPFRELASENISDIELFHVNLEIDDTLHAVIDEVLSKENRAIVAVVGEHGSGKTERLMMAATEAKQRKAFTVYFDVTSKTPWILRGLAEEFRKTAEQSGLTKTFSSPAWMRALAPIEKLKDEKYDPIAAGRAIGQALNDTAPSLLLLNDLHNLMESKEIHAFAKTLQQVSDVIKPGVLIMFDCFPSYLAWLTVNLAPFASRINRTIRLPGLTSDEAALLLAKKMLPKRMVEDLDPIYPFDKESVVALNEAAGGNPRRLIELADLSIEFGASHKLYRVDSNVVRVVQPLRTSALAAGSVAGRTTPPVTKEQYSEEPSTKSAGPAKPAPIAGAQTTGGKSG